MSDLREQIRDEIAGWPVGDGYYGSTISVEEAGGLADAVLAVLGQEFAHGRPASMPDMSGRQQWTIVGGPYSSRDVAERMAKTRPVVKDLPVTVLTRIVSEWEEADDE